MAEPCNCQSDIKLPPMPGPVDTDHARWGYTSDMMDAYATDAVIADRALRAAPAPQAVPAEPVLRLTIKREGTKTHVIYDENDALFRMESGIYSLYAAPAAPAADAVQWWLAELDQYGNAKLVDGAHDERAGADKAAYLFDALHLSKPGVRYAVARVELSKPRPSAGGVNHEAVDLVNAARAGQAQEGEHG